jgi:hypothetical protein
MKKIILSLIILVFFSKIVNANDYYWDLINSLIKDEFQKAEMILNYNIKSMTVQEKRLMMQLTLTYSRGLNTVNVLNILLNNNIFPNSLDLYTAINTNQPNAAIHFLLQNGAIPNGEILLLAMTKQRYDLAKQFIKAGVDVNYRYPLARNYADGMTALLYASKWNNLEIVKMLIENGADMNVREINGNTALALAQANGNKEISNFLIEHGAIETFGNNNSSMQNTGISDILENRAVNFQTGTYRLFGGSNSMRFTGNLNSGNISYANITTGRVINGIYRKDGNNLTIIIDGYTFVYKIDSNDSFSGNEEVWVRIVN